MADLELEAWVGAARGGDRGAFQRIVTRVQKAAVAICYGRLGHRELAADAAQDAFIDAYVHLHQLEEPRAFLSWFRRILGKHCDRRFRRKTFTTSGAELETIAQSVQGAASGADAKLLQNENADLTWRLVEALPEHERTAVALFYFAEQPLQVIARLLEISENVVKQRLHSARKRMREDIMTRVEDAMRRQWSAQNADLADRVAIFLAIRTGDEQLVRTLIAREPALLEASEEWDAGAFTERDLPMAERATPLIRAAERGQTAIVHALLQAGAQVDGNCGCVTRETPLWASVVTGQLEAALALLARGADPNAESVTGIACLHVAAMRGHVALVDALLAHGADPALLDREGRTAADWAALKGYPGIANQLGHEAASATCSPEARAHAASASMSTVATPTVYQTGIKAINLFAPQRVGGLTLVRGGAGVGRNILLAELAYAAHRKDVASVWVIREREPWSEAELEQLVNETALRGIVRVLRVSPEDGARVARQQPLRAVECAKTLIAGGARHVQLAFFEAPDSRTAIEAVLPDLGVRADGAAISAFVVPPWQLADEVERVLKPPFDAVLALDPRLAAARCFPAVDPRRSHARWSAADLDPRHEHCAAAARELLSRFAQDSGEMSDLDRSRAARLRAYLTQPFTAAEPFSGRPGASVSRPELLADVDAIVSGELDAEPEAHLWYRGALTMGARR